MAAVPDARWVNIVGGLADDGTVKPMSFDVLDDLTKPWATLVGDRVPEGIRELLATCRSLFAHAWFNYDFMAVACLVGLQAVEAAVRQVVVTDARPTTPLARLVRRAAADGRLPGPQVEWLLDGVKLRNRMSHPGGQASFSVGLAAPLVETSHRIIQDLCDRQAEAGRDAPA